MNILFVIVCNHAYYGAKLLLFFDIRKRARHFPEKKFFFTPQKALYETKSKKITQKFAHIKKKQ